MKLWIKIIRSEKIIKDTVAEGNLSTVSALHSLLSDVCDKLNCPMPIVTETDLSNLIKFNHIKFLHRDFLETPDFDFMDVSHLAEKKKQQ